MSFLPTAFRPFARSGMGGIAAGHFRGPSARGPSARGPSARGQIGTVVYRSLGNQIIHSIAGITRDNAGAVLPNCVVEMFSTTTDALISRTTSDGAGAYTLPVSGPGGPFYIVAYKAGSPDVAGTTVNTLVAV